MARPSITPEESLGQRRRIGWRRETGLVDQPVEQRRPPAKLFGQGLGMGKDQRQQVRQLRPGAQQPIEVHPARQLVDDVAEPVDRPDRVGASGHRAHQRRQHALRTRHRAAGERSDRARPDRQSHDPAKGLFDLGESPSPQVRNAGCPDRWTTAPRAPKPARRIAARPLRHGAPGRPGTLRRDSLPSSLATASSAAGSLGQAMLLPVVDHLDAMLGRPQRAIGIARCVVATAGIEPPCPRPAPRAPRASPVPAAPARGRHGPAAGPG